MKARAGLAAIVSLVAASALAPSLAFAQTRYVDELFPDAVLTQPDVVYGEARNSRGEVESLTLDVYEPAGDTATGRGLYIWVHGGNFRVGSKSQRGPLVDYVKRGWVGISINYRLRPELPGNAAIGAVTDPASLPAFIEGVTEARHDVQAAVRWARFHAEELRVDPDRIAIGGISAGAILSLMVNFNEEDPGNTVTSDVPRSVSSGVAAAVSHAGAYAPVLLGDVPRPGDSPIAVYHGTNDEQVPYPLAPLVCLLQLAVLNDCEYVTFVSENHRTLGTDLARDFLYRHVILGRAETRIPLVTNLESDPIQVLAGVEPAGVDLGATVGVVAPTNTETYADNTEQLLRYALNALGVPLPE